MKTLTLNPKNKLTFTAADLAVIRRIPEDDFEVLLRNVEDWQECDRKARKACRAGNPDKIQFMEEMRHYHKVVTNNKILRYRYANPKEYKEIIDRHT